MGKRKVMENGGKRKKRVGENPASQYFDSTTPLLKLLYM